ncbi:putative response regulator ArlR [Heyndrickxia coagulans]|nr:putative response regulator ArlR [Heyndrickxia coagulans]
MEVLLMKLLIVEDNVSLLESMKRMLEDEFEVETATDGEEALYLAQQNIFDIILLDVMLPEMDGFSILKTLRKDRVETPVLFVTAKDSLEDRVTGLEIGGDDYIVKPFQAAELKARIRASLRRSGNMTIDHTLRYRGIELFGKEKEIKVDGQPLKLTITQYELLEYLIQNSGNILTREQIFDRVWGFESDTTIAIVEVYIHHLRKKLEPFGYHKDIQNVRGIGYLLKEPDK